LPTRIARTIFTVKGKHMVLLHGFIKKTQATPLQDIELAHNRIDF
jgi:phage-related protein